MTDPYAAIERQIEDLTEWASEEADHNHYSASDTLYDAANTLRDLLAVARAAEKYQRHRLDGEYAYRQWMDVRDALAKLSPPEETP